MKYNVTHFGDGLFFLVFNALFHINNIMQNAIFRVRQERVQSK